ncbi:manganese catalase family protein [Clostridium sp. SYSU_GA19001]|uniref:ferritin-like domain-containing protein n=1 Tax=Clostridium caldaquaticum TaxID=2940653 RepID=UPI0020777BD4|nr:manganese catalase family protein [Clostridium caldaquaticum]MCM8711681.1 manganese catalase family protein [Clostridium caldaquaticum]
MPGDISKHTNYIIKLPYPEPKIEIQNVQYANLLLEDYAGAVSEFTAINLYVYQHIVSEGNYDDYAELIGGVSMAEMKHLELLGETIKLLGVKPIYINSACPPGELWSPIYVNFTTHIKEMLREDIQAESKAIETYKYHISIIGDKYIKQLLERIILDEELHLKLFMDMFKKYNNII